MIEAVVAVFVYQKEIFYFQRQLTLKAFPGYHAFPGGKIDDDESEIPFETEYLKDYSARIMHALCRELLEELNFNLELAINNNEVRIVEYLGLAKPPVSAIGKFVAHHFKIVLNKKIKFSSEPEEALDSGWISVESLLQSYIEGKILAVIPTRRVIEKLAKDIATKKIEPLNVTCTEKEIPVLELMNGIHFLFIISKMLKKPYYTNAIIVGDPAYIIDPSPYSDEEFEKLIFSLKPFKLNGIVITHHHLDHHQHAGKLAKRLNIHIKCSSITHGLILKEYGNSYFNDIVVKHVNEGDILTNWLGQNIIVYNLPGHDDGQIGLAPENLQWFLVGDLINAADWRITGAEIPDESGDIAKYIESINRIIEMDPAIIIPSHGMPLGSTYHLKNTIKSL